MNTCANEEACKEEASWMYNPYEKGWLYITPSYCNGSSKRHIAQNTKAVNDYANTSQLAYVYNSYLHPEPYKYLKDRGEHFAPSLERFALTELVQWVYRSRVRCNEPINLYIPSGRMRGIFTDWMEGKYL